MCRRVLLMIFCIGCAVMLPLNYGGAEGRAALVIGNSAYKHTKALANPRNDATDVAAALRYIGFQVTLGLDLEKAAMDTTIREFASTLRDSEAAVFFYAGHGLQVDGVNYLVPVDARLENASALDFELTPLNLIQRSMEREAKTNILFIDACRDNPLARNLARGMGTRTIKIERGLAAAESGIGTLISFSTQPGNVALDGAGRNSPFAEALVKHMATPREDLSAILIRVRLDVMKVTDKKQVPWEHSALTGKFYFDKSSTKETVGVPSDRNEAAEAWAAAKDSSHPAVLEAFLRRFGDTFYGDVARARLEELKRQKEVSVSPSAGAKPAVPPQVRELARAQSEELRAVVRQATRTREQLAVVVEITNTGRDRIGIAVEEYPLGIAGSLLGDDGTSCTVSRVQGLVRLWVYSNYDAGVEESQQTIIAPNSSVTTVISFAASECKGPKQLNSGLLTLPLFFFNGKAITKHSSLVIPSIPLQ